MSHLDEGRLLALRDGLASLDDAARTHLAACDACGGALEEARIRGAAVAEALSSLDGDWDLEAARARVRERVAGHAAASSGTRSLVGLRSRAAAWGLSRAAGILLVTAAAVSALPGSPVRAWLGEVLGSSEEAAVTRGPVEEASSAPSAAAAAEATGVRLSVPHGALRVVLQEVASGSEIRVRMVPGTEAAVFAPTGSRFTSAEGRLEARVTPGEVRVELPTGVDPVSIEVGGRIYLRSTDAGLDVRGPVASRTGDEIMFRVPQD